MDLGGDELVDVVCPSGLNSPRRTRAHATAALE
jgi:hypothetical protein